MKIKRKNVNKSILKNFDVFYTNTMLSVFLFFTMILKGTGT